MSTNLFSERVLAPGQIAQQLRSARSQVVTDIDDAVLDAVIAKLSAIGNWNDDALAPTRALAGLIKRNVELFVDKPTRQALVGCEVFVVPIAYCGAYCAAPRTIVIGSGLLDYLAANLFWGDVAHRMPEELSEVFHPQFGRASLREVIPVLLLGLLYRHYRHGDKLPNYQALVSPETAEQVRHALAGGMTFVLLHELGHIELGHHRVRDGTCARSVDLPFQVPEDFSVNKLEELAADDYARASMVEAYRPLHTAWINTALGPHFLLETILSWRGAEHPICINRLAHAHASARDPVDRSAYLENLKSTAQRYQSIESHHRALRERGAVPLLERYTRSKLISLLRDMDERTGGSYTKAATSPADSWQMLIEPAQA